jgi:DNA polymerase III delta prime subunit
MGPKQLKATAKRFYKSRQPFMVAGPPGVGKSNLLKQVAEELGIGFIDFRLNMFDPVDLRGIPMPDAKEGVTRWLHPDFLPKDGAGILLMDELTAATTAVQAAAYQITLDRRLGDYKLPDGWSVMAAGNRQSDRAVAYKMPSALVSRLNMQTLEVSQKDFEEFAVQSGRIISEVIAFLRFKPGLMMDFDPIKWKDNTPFACPRTWEFLSHDMKANNNETTLDIVRGFVGPGAGAEFYGFMKVYQELPSIDEILAKPMTAKVPTDPAPLYAIATSLARHVTPKNADNVFTYLGRMPNEFEMCSVKDMAARSLDMTNCKAFNQWLIKHGHLFA